MWHEFVAKLQVFQYYASPTRYLVVIDWERIACLQCNLQWNSNSLNLIANIFETFSRVSVMLDNLSTFIFNNLPISLARYWYIFVIFFFFKIQLLIQVIQFYSHLLINWGFCQKSTFPNTSWNRNIFIDWFTSLLTLLMIRNLYFACD